jgi:hypothetical protein
MNHNQEARVTRDNGLCTLLTNTTADYAGDAAFEAIATKTIADYVLTTKAATAAAADNTGYSLDKYIAKIAASNISCQLCAGCQVKAQLLGNNILFNALNGTVSFFSHTSDALSASRMQNVHDVMQTNLVLLTPDYITAAKLTTFQTKITDFTELSGTTTSVNSTSPVVTKALADAIKTGAADVVNIKKLAKKYQPTNPTFYNNIIKACKIPAITVRHTPVVITVTESLTGTPLANASGTLSKTTQVGVGTDAGIITYTNVSAGTAIATCAADGYITGVRTIKIKRGKPNAFFFVLVAGVMTTEMVAAIKTKIAAFIAAEDAKRLDKIAKAKANKEKKSIKTVVVS